MTDYKPPSDSAEQQVVKWYDRTRYQILLFIGGIALFVLVGGWILDWYIEPHTSGQKKDLVQALGLITAGVAGAVGIIFTWRGQRLTQKGLQDTLRTTREGQITDRFTRAIDQLGKVEDGQKLFEIRVGGIYALERIARESEEDYYWPIMEILTAYVRQNAPWPPEVGQERTEDATDEQRAMEGSGGKSETTEPAGPDPDIQAIMTILRRRKRRYMHGEPEALDLHKSNLSGANLREANLSGANLKAANLRKADLRKADLRGASFWLRGAKFWKANLREARLNEADLREANLNEADLREADLSGANLSGARFSKADFRGADLRGADLSGARSLTQAQLDEQGIKGDKDTQLPSPLKPPRYWGVKTDEQNEES